MLRTTYILPADIKANYGEIIAKDLEILEIVKPYLQDLYDDEQLYWYLGKNEKTEKIKEWLENGK